MEKSFYLQVAKKLVKDFNGDIASAWWYAALVDYSQRFKRDRSGFFRVSRQAIMDDFGLSRAQIRTLNAKLVAKGLIKVDNVSRGGKTPAGYKLL